MDGLTGSAADAFLDHDLAAELLGLLVEKGILTEDEADQAHERARQAAAASLRDLEEYAGF